MLSTYEYRDLLRRRIDEKINGDGKESGGLIETVLSRTPKDYAVYRDLTGQIAAYRTVLTIMDEVWKDMTDPAPSPPTGVSNG